jgi:integrase
VKLNLTTKTVAALALAKGRSEEFAWDEGFGLRLRRRRDGKVLRSWVAQYRTHGRTRRVTLGACEKLTPAQAREAARKILARVALGHDPQAEKAAKRVRAARTLQSVVAAYLAEKQTELRPSSLRALKLYLTGKYFRPLHAMGVDEITRADVAARLSAIARDHSANAAASARTALSACITWAMQAGLTESNPVIGTRKPNGAAPRDRVLTGDELRRVWRACGDDDYGRIVRLLILLGSRRQELGGLRRTELVLDGFDEAFWALPAERSKNHRAHVVPLPPAALAIIKSVPRQEGRDCLFGQRADVGFTGWSEAKAKLDRQLAGAAPAWRLHDIRRTVATGMADIGVEPHVIEAVLNHYSGHRKGPHGTYNVSRYERAVKIALQRWGEHVLSLVEQRKSNVSNALALART